MPALTCRRTYGEAAFQIVRNETRADGWKIKRQRAEWRHASGNTKWAAWRLQYLH